SSVDHAVSLVAGRHQLLELLVLGRMGFGIANHFLNLILRQTGRCFDHNRLLLASSLVFGRHMQDTVGVDVEGHLNLRHTTGRRRNICQVKAAQRFVLCCLLTLTLNHVNGYRSLVIFRCGENLRFFGRNRGVLLDQRGCHTTHGFNTQGQRSHVQQQYVFNFTRQNRTLNRRTNSDCLVRVHVLTGLFAEELFNLFLYQRHPCLAAHQNHLVHFAMAQACIFQGNTARLDALLNQVFYQRLQLGTSQLDVQVLRTTGIRGNVRQVDISLLATRQLHLGLLCSFFQTLHGQRVTFEVHARLFAELFYQEVNHPHIEVFTTQEGVTVGCQHFELHFAIDVGNLDNGNIEGTTTQVINGNLAVTAFLVQTIGQRCGSRLVDDPLHIKTRNASCIFGGLTLRVVEIGRNRDNRCCNGLAQVVFRRFLHFLENFSGNLGRCLFLAARL